MLSKKTSALIASAMAFGMAAPAMAGEAELRAQLDAVQAKLAALEQTQNEAWLTERRAEEIKGLISDVLTDANTRATLLQDSTMAGYDNGKFFLQSADGNFKLNIGGKVQVRYMATFQANRKVDTDSDGFADTEKEKLQGIQLRRAELKFSGHIVDPSWTFKINLQTGRTDGKTITEEAAIAKQVSDELQIACGIDQLPFLREGMASSTRVLAVDRGIVTNIFDTGHGAGLMAKYNAGDNLKIAAALSNGVTQNYDTTNEKPIYGNNGGYQAFGTDTTDYALTARADMKLAGSWDQADDYVSWAGDNTAWFAGGAFHYMKGDDVKIGADAFGWTLDTLYKSQGWTASLAVSGMDVNADDADHDFDAYGVMAQLAYNMNDKLQPFVRYEWADVCPTGQNQNRDHLQALTVGANYFMKKHNAKITTDIVWAFRGANVFQNAWTGGDFSEGLGLNETRSEEFEEDNLVAARAQLQLAF